MTYTPEEHQDAAAAALATDLAAWPAGSVRAYAAPLPPRLIQALLDDAPALAAAPNYWTDRATLEAAPGGPPGAPSPGGSPPDASPASSEAGSGSSSSASAAAGCKLAYRTQGTPQTCWHKRLKDQKIKIS